MGTLIPNQSLGAGGLYIHVPFCPRVCPYCDFAVLKAPERLHEDWFVGVQKELRTKHHLLPELKTLYLGGGTPTLLSDAHLIALKAEIQKYWNWDSLQERAIEGNPETLSPERIQLLAELGFTRLTIGVQSFVEERLQWLGRGHTRDLLDKLHKILVHHPTPQMAIGIDLMFGFKEQSLAEIQSEIQTALDWPIQHLSLYGLTIESNTLFGQKDRKGEALTEDEIYDDLYLFASDLLESHGFMRYEVSNFAKQGFEGLHNQAYWNQSPYLGIGPGAHSYLKPYRFSNQRNLKDWFHHLESSELQNLETLNPLELREEFLMLHMRQAKGIAQEDLLSEEWLTAQKWIQNASMEMKGERLCLSGLGWVYMDKILAEWWHILSKNRDYLALFELSEV
jgi:oxygen-independent coproporphyrinogen-3 oxidase